MLGIFLNHGLPHILRPCFKVNLELTIFLYDWQVSSRDLPVSTSPALKLEECTTMPSFLHGYSVFTSVP